MNALRTIRTQVFRATQAEMALIAGVTQATISRWENGVSPSLQDMGRIRREAIERGLSWRDAFFFEDASG